MFRRNNFYGSVMTILRCLYSMDGIDELIDIGDVSALELNTFTVSAKHQRSSINSTQNIYAQQTQLNAAHDICGVLIRFSSTNKILVAFVIGGVYEIIQTATSYTSTSMEYDIAVTKSGTAVTIYVNGVVAATGTLTSATIDYSTTTIKKTDMGAVYSHSLAGFTHFLSGKTRDVRVYNSALNITDINLIKNWSYAPTGMIANWIGENATDSWDGSNWTVVDSVSANNGTSVNMEIGDRIC